MARPRGTAIVLVAALLALAAPVLASSDRRVAPGANGRVAFASQRDGNFEIYAMDAAGTQLARLTNDPGVDSAPAFSPDGRRIAFESNRPGFSDIFAMDADGSGLVNLTNAGGDDSAPSYSPDGTRIVYARNAAGNFEIYAMDAATGANPVDLSNHPDGELDPAFSPTGTRIAYMRNVNGNNFEVFAMNADGSAQTNLSQNAAVDHQAAFSPDGQRIAFSSNRDGNYEIYVMNLDGSAQTRLTTDPGSDTQPAFSPDGTRIVFASDRTGDVELHSMLADGTGVGRLTTSAGEDRAPDWGVAVPTPAPATTPTPTSTPTLTVTPTPTAAPTPPPAPDFKDSVVVAPVKGVVTVRIGGQTVPLEELREIPLGAVVDTREGRVQLTAQTAGSLNQAAVFYAGRFQVGQTSKATTLKLVGRIGPCPNRRRAAVSRASKKRKLWGNGKGDFTTKGKLGSATVQGTKWLTEDSCAGTRVQVARGRVAVRDFARNRTTLVRQGEQRLIRAR